MVWCFCLELLGGKSLISGKPLMCWRISTCSSPKGLAWTWICAVRRSLLVYNQDFSSHVLLFCSFCAAIVRGWRMHFFNKSPVAKLIHKTWPARLICLTIIQRSEFSWLWHPQNTKKKDFLDFAGLNKDRNTILLRNSSEGLWLGLKKHWSQGFKNP